MTLNTTPTDAVSSRFWAKVLRGDDCWLWTGAIQKRAGYGRFNVNGRAVLAHRFVYEDVVGPIPEGKQIDHLCMTKACVRPDHLEAVTPAVNVQRASEAGLLRPERDGRRGHKPHCPHGHPYEGWNLIVDSDGKRRCRECANERQRRRRARRADT